MGKYLEKAKELRAITDVHYNCAQSVICAFEELTGLDDATSRKIGANFGSGMKRGGTCGAGQYKHVQGISSTPKNNFGSH